MYILQLRLILLDNFWNNITNLILLDNFWNNITNLYIIIIVYYYLYIIV